MICGIAKKGKNGLNIINNSTGIKHLCVLHASFGGVPLANIALIPARAGSKRIPNKNMMDFCGKPLVQWTIEQAEESVLVDTVVLSTNIREDLCQLKFSTKSKYLKRPAELCFDTATQEEVIAHAIQALQLKDDDNIVLLQPTSPLRLPGDIDNCLATLKYHYASWSVNFESDLFLWTDDVQPYNFERDCRGVCDYYRENGSIYAFGIEQFKTCQNRYANGNGVYFFKKWQQFEIDEPEDIEICEFFMKKYIIKEGK